MHADKVLFLALLGMAAPPRPAPPRPAPPCSALLRPRYDIVQQLLGACLSPGPCEAARMRGRHAGGEVRDGVCGCGRGCIGTVEGGVCGWGCE